MLRTPALVATLLLSSFAQQGSEPTPPAPRSESFALWQPSATPGVELLAGYAQWRRHEDSNGSVQLELELLFVRGQNEGERRRVIHVEHLGPDGPSLVWREIALRGGRTLSLSPARSGGDWICEEWDGSDSIRTPLDTHSGAALPLYFLELVREGGFAAGPCTLFDPLSRSLETLSLSTSHVLSDADPTAALARKAEFLRADGTLAGRYVFRGRELESFQWQEGGAVARRISTADFAHAAAATAEIDKLEHP